MWEAIFVAFAVVVPLVAACGGDPKAVGGACSRACSIVPGQCFEEDAECVVCAFGELLECREGRWTERTLGIRWECTPDKDGVFCAER